MTIIERIESEQGRPFWELVKELADSGESARGVAKKLGMSPSTINKLVTAKGVKDWFPAMSNARRAYYASIVGVCTPSHIERLQKARAAAPAHVVYLHNGVTDSIAGHARRLGLSRNTVYARRKAGLPIERILAPVAPNQKRKRAPKPKFIKAKVVPIRTKTPEGSFAWPCKDCNHKAVCAAQQLSCKAFGNYVRSTRWKPEMRAPGRDWFERAREEDAA